MSTRMRQRLATSKPRVYKLTNGGMWWADVVVGHTYYCELFSTYAEAIAKAHEYARMVKA
jgi:hypothetical protein